MLDTSQRIAAFARAALSVLEAVDPTPAINPAAVVRQNEDEIDMVAHHFFSTSPFPLAIRTHRCFLPHQPSQTWVALPPQRPHQPLPALQHQSQRLRQWWLPRRRCKSRITFYCVYFYTIVNLGFFQHHLPGTSFPG